MKFLSLLTALGCALFFAVSCNKTESNIELPPVGNDSCFKGRLELKQACMNYTIKLLEGNLSSERIESSWTDPKTATVYENVFRLGSRCSFPDSIKQGDSFYFRIINYNPGSCAICEAFYPTPPKSLSIQVINSPCPTNK